MGVPPGVLPPGGVPGVDIVDVGEVLKVLLKGRESKFYENQLFIVSKVCKQIKYSSPSQNLSFRRNRYIAVKLPL